MRTLPFSLFIILVFALMAGCSRDPVAPDLADPGSIEPAANETPSGLGALIDRLESEGGLTHGQATSLRSHLKNAVKFEERGDIEKADGVYEHMIQQVGGWRDNGGVTRDVAEGLISYLQSLFLANKFVSISAGDVHNCGLRPSGIAYCWGDISGGPESTPVKVVGGHHFASIDAGSLHTCGVTASTSPRDPGGVGYCWGYNGDGQLGNGTTNDSDVPVPVAGGHHFASISAGGLHTCGVTTTGYDYCWGYNGEGQLGNGTTNSSDVPVPVLGGHAFASINAGNFHNCGVTTSGANYCWGRNTYGQLGDGTNDDRHTPVLVSGGVQFATIDAGSLHTCGVTAAGAGYCWGENEETGQLGNGAIENSNVPVPVFGGHTFASIRAGTLHTCGVTTAGAAYCWGDNEDGELGTGLDTNSDFPVAVAGGLQFTSIDPGSGHTCGVTTNEKGYCWGSNDFGQLGNGTFDGSDVPVPVASP